MPVRTAKHDVMNTIGAGALPRQIPRILDAVKAGARFTVTRRDQGTNWKDEPVALLIPVSSFAEHLHRLREEDLNFLLGDLLSFNIDGRVISASMVEHVKAIRYRLQGEQDPRDGAMARAVRLEVDRRLELEELKREVKP